MTLRIAIVGHTSQVAQEFARIIGSTKTDFKITRYGRPENVTTLDLTANRYFLICSGYLAGRSLGEISEADANQTWRANFLEPAQLCDRVMAANDQARICVLGSHSGIAGSYDMAYAGAKAAMHLYVETKRLSYPDQLLVGLAPWIIGDAGMTTRRDDLGHLEGLKASSRHGRFISAAEVAREAVNALFSGSTFLSNTIIKLRGDAR